MADNQLYAYEHNERAREKQIENEKTNEQLSTKGERASGKTSQMNKFSLACQHWMKGIEYTTIACLELLLLCVYVWCARHEKWELI